MRTLEQIQANIAKIDKLIFGIKEQVELMKTEYRQNALECTGGPCDTFEKMIADLESGKDALITLFHMEIDLEDYV